ncbi:hypothetical protein [Weissella tructae]|uniref:hypothetical protein n=1 Tax=Weissella tructae TaxID=887702 RepID=UPI001BDBE513|nr:hypothetical protein [Weissella tructae]QVV90826.1 hypothetical protein KHQ32_04110 [Weissella tructae]
MIISLADAQKIDPNVTQSYLDGLEVAIRQLTNNKFLNKAISYRSFFVSDESKVTVKESNVFLRQGDTVQLAYTGVNDGLYTVSGVNNGVVVLETDKLFNGKYRDGMLTKVEYPTDIVEGVKRLIKYDMAMSKKVGIKSETISRMSRTYHDVNSSENVNGYPSAYMDFLNKYRKLRW